MKQDSQEQPAQKPSSMSWQFSAIIAASLVVAMAIYTPLGPVRDYRKSKGDLAQSRERARVTNKLKEGELQRLRDQEQLMTLLKERKPEFELWTFMNAVLTEAKLRNGADLQQYQPSRSDKKAAAIEEGVTMVQLKLTGVSLKDLVNLLHGIYSSNNLVAMYRLDFIKASTNNKGVDCSIVFLTPKAGAA